MDNSSTKINVSKIGFSTTELEFIKNHIHDDVNQLVLKSGQFKGIDVKKLAAQILPYLR